MNLDDELEKLFPSLDLSEIKGTLYNYQKDCIKFLCSAGGRAIIADDPGTGKSAESLGYIVHSKKRKVLIVCPASMKYVWEAEIAKWTSLTSYVITPKDKLLPNESNIYIINYDILKKHLEKLINIKWDMIIGDEGHFIKEPSAIRSKCFKTIAKNVPEVIFLTGTPILSRPIELFNLLNTLDKKSWPSWYLYAKRYCDAHHTRFGFDVSGASNLNELKDRIKGYFIRRTKNEILKELPPKRLINIPVHLEGNYKKQYDLALSEFRQYLIGVKGKTDQETRKTLQAEKLTRMGYLRQIASEGKVEYISELLGTLIDSGEKVIVFSNYNNPLLELHKKYKNSVILLGSTPVEDRKQIIDKFQTDEKVKVFFGGIKSGGIGITLTAASSIIFADYSWVPADHIQASDRAHRPGTKAESINIYQFFAQNTIDEYMKETLEEKQEIINAILGTGDSSYSSIQLNIFNDVLKKLL